MILSICICSLDKRLAMLAVLMRYLQEQADMYPGQVEILVESDDGKIPTGTKRNTLYRKAKGKYVVSVDDDDWVPNYYISEIMRAIQTDPDVVGMHGHMNTDGKKNEGWFISMYNPYLTTSKLGRNFYLRYPNHITVIRHSIAIQYPFPDIYDGEDYAFATAMHDANAYKTEVQIPEHLPMYEYRYISRK